MPTFFRKDHLTQTQLDNWDNAIAKYNKIHENNLLNQFSSMNEAEKKEALRGDYDLNIVNDKIKLLPILVKNFMYMAQPGDEKSALFFRLLNGKKALIKPPPLSFSYPCYEFIESEEPIELSMLSTNVTAQGLVSNPERYIKYKHMIIDQSPWKVLEVISDKELLITHQNWESLGFVWSLSLVDVKLENSTTSIICHYDSTVGQIYTYNDLIKEVEFHTNLHFNKMLVSLNDDIFQKHKNDLEKKYDKLGQRMAEQDKLESEKYIKERLKNNLTIEPTQNELDEFKKNSLKQYLTDIFVGENNVLYKKSWILNRIQPKKLNLEIYLE